MKRTMILTTVLSSGLTALSFWAMGMAKLPSLVKLDNKRVKVTEVMYEPGVPRERYIRPTDQVIVFLDESRYERTDSKTKEKPSGSANPGKSSGTTKARMHRCWSTLERSRTEHS